jgi:predicted TIM-barrel fold metal-dependent hydrolase
MQFIEGDLFTKFPALKFVISHGGGAVTRTTGGATAASRTG